MTNPLFLETVKAYEKMGLKVTNVSLQQNTLGPDASQVSIEVTAILSDPVVFAAMLGGTPQPT